MNLLFSCIGQRGYIADFFRPHLGPDDRILGTGNTRWTPGFTRCDGAFILPDIDSEEYLSEMLELCQSQRIDAVFSFNDLDVVTLAKAHDQFSNIGTRLLVPPFEIAEIAYDKYKTYEFLSSKSFLTPRTALDPNAALDFAFPVYVKPRRGSGSLDTFVARNRQEMLAFFDYRSEMIIQESIVGEPINIDLCTDFDGHPIGVSTWKKYRSRLGETEQAETFNDPAVTAFALELGKCLGATGPMDVDVFRQGEKIVVLEANTRFGGGYPVSHLAGADFPNLLMQLVRFGNAQPNYSFSTGVVMMKRLEIIGGEAGSFFSSELKV